MVLVDVQGSRVTAYRRLAWNETDAAGHNHFSAAVRWLEETEHALYRTLGLNLDFIDRVPRVSVRLDYFRRLYFGEELRIELGVVRVGTSSCCFAFEVFDSQALKAVSGEYVVVHVESTDGGSAPWPQEIREAFLRGDHGEIREVVNHAGGPC
jgi:acyl-CoA thioester hydrolase